MGHNNVVMKKVNCSGTIIDTTRGDTIPSTVCGNINVKYTFSPTGQLMVLASTVP